MAYPKMPDFRGLTGQLGLYAQLQHEYGVKGIQKILNRAEKAVRDALKELKALPPDPKLAAREPSGLDEIRALRPKGPRRMWDALDPERYAERLEGALIGRFAGCILGAPVEFWDIEKMEELARTNRDQFPPVRYWKAHPTPDNKRYGISACSEYTRTGMDGVPADDDLTYTLLGLLILEEHGPDFTTADVGKSWLKYLPMACTAEAKALANLKDGVPAEKAGALDNPMCEWIGADIRSDPWGYMAPAWPELAADMAWRDAYLSHRRQGIYGEMLFAATIAAAFALDDPVEALQVGLTEIPKSCALARAVRWALKVGPEITSYREARDAMDERFAGMNGVHTINNACLTVWGLTIGGTDFTRAIGETVAMGNDNDCTAATVGSIVGAAVGIDGIPEHWYADFNNKVVTYMLVRDRWGKRFRIDSVLKRFARQARRCWRAAS